MVRVKHHRRIFRNLFALWAVYLVAGNLFVATPIGQRLIAPHPERFAISWGPAWTVIPGLVHVRNLEIRQHTKDVVWSLKIDRAVTGVNLLALPFKTFHAVFPKTSGVDVVVDRAATTMPPSGKTGPGWRIRLTGATIDHIRSMEFWGIGIKGDDLSVKGALDTTARGPFGIPDARVTVTDARVTADDVPLANGLDLDIRAGISTHGKEDRLENGFFRYISGRIEASGDIEDLRFIDTFVRGLPWLAVRGGSGRLEADLELTDGDLEPDSRMTIQTSAFTFGYLDYEVEGVGTIVLAGRDDSGTDAELDFELDNFHLAFKDSEMAHIEGTGLTLRIVGILDDMVQHRGTSRVTLDIPPSRIPDLGIYNRYLADHSSFRILSGEGTLESHLTADGTTGTGGGTIEIRADDALCSIAARTLRADLVNLFHIRIDDLEHRRFSVDGSKIEITQAGVATPDEQGTLEESEPQWWCTLDIDRGSLTLTPPLVMDLDTRFVAFDAAPILALMTSTRKSADRLDRLLAIHDLSGGARITIDRGTTFIDNAHVEGGRLEILGKLCLGKDTRSGAIFISYGILNLSVELLDDDAKKHVITPKKWYDGYVENLSCEGTPTR